MRDKDDWNACLEYSPQAVMNMFDDTIFNHRNNMI